MLCEQTDKQPTMPRWGQASLNRTAWRWRVEWRHPLRPVQSVAPNGGNLTAYHAL